MIYRQILPSLFFRTSLYLCFSVQPPLWQDRLYSRKPTFPRQLYIIKIVSFHLSSISSRILPNRHLPTSFFDRYYTEHIIRIQFLHAWKSNMALDYIIKDRWIYNPSTQTKIHLKYRGSTIFRNKSKLLRKETSVQDLDRSLSACYEKTQNQKLSIISRIILFFTYRILLSMRKTTMPHNCPQTSITEISFRT